jgi:hypothetical protein
MAGGRKHPAIVSSNFTVIEKKNDKSNHYCTGCNVTIVPMTATACKTETTNISNTSQILNNVPMLLLKYASKP